MFTFWKLLLDRQDNEQAPACRRIFPEQHSSFSVLYTPSLCCVSAGQTQKLDGHYFQCTKGCRIAGLLPHQILSNSDEWFSSYWHQNCAKRTTSDKISLGDNYLINHCQVSVQVKLTLTGSSTATATETVPNLSLICLGQLGE